MFNFDRVKNIVLNNKYIKYLNDIGIDTAKVIENIKINIEKKGSVLDKVFSNRIYEMLSPNILVESIIFEEINKFLFENYKESIVFEEEVSIDIKSILASQNSIIDRPNIKKPSEMKKGFIEEFNVEDNFVRIARFESEIIKDSHDIGRKGQSVLFEAVVPFKVEIRPFSMEEPSFNIWENIFYEYEPRDIIGFCKSFNSIESNNILWLNSYFINEFELKLDSFNNGLRALNQEDELILEFRQWRKDLIGNGASFVGHDSNIATFEGCDLLLREDYFQELNKIFPELIIRIEKIES